MVCPHIRPLNLCQMPLRNFGQKRELQCLEKYVLLCRVFKFVIKQNSLVHYLRGNFFAYTIELIGFKILFANSWLLQSGGQLRKRAYFSLFKKVMSRSRKHSLKSSLYYADQEKCCFHLEIFDLRHLRGGFVQKLAPATWKRGWN